MYVYIYLYIYIHIKVHANSMKLTIERFLHRNLDDFREILRSPLPILLTV